MRGNVNPSLSPVRKEGEEGGREGKWSVVEVVGCGAAEKLLMSRRQAAHGSEERNEILPDYLRPLF